MRTTLAFLVCVTACFLYSAFLGYNVMASKMYPESVTPDSSRDTDEKLKADELAANAHIAILEDLLIPGTKWENDEVFDQENLQHVRSAVPYLKIRENGQVARSSFAAYDVPKKGHTIALRADDARSVKTSKESHPSEDTFESIKDKMHADELAW